MRFRVQIGAEEVYLENLTLAGALVDLPPEHQALLKDLAWTHPGTREACAYEDGLLPTFFLEEQELPFGPILRYYAVAERFLKGPEGRCFPEAGEPPG